MRRWLAILVLAACSHAPRQEPATGPPEPARAPGSAPSIELGNADAGLGWRSVELADAHLTVDLFEGPSKSRSWQPGGVVVQFQHEINLAVRAGKDETIEHWREYSVLPPEWTLSAPEPIVVCGRPAVTQTARAPEWHGEVKDTSGYRMMAVPARTEVIVAFEQAGLGVTARWEIATARRAEWAAAERHFFQSLSCR
jgi:hypothetical protein